MWSLWNGMPPSGMIHIGSRMLPEGRSITMKRRKAFTLIELLVVIAIIALLMGILMPTLHLARNQARSAGCQMNLHHWGVIWAMYCDDNEGRFPECGNLGWRRGTWIIALRPHYQTRSGILTCPMATKRLPSGENHGGPFNTYVMGTGGIGDRREEGSYGANCWIYNPGPQDIRQGDIQGRDINYNWRTKDVKGGDQIPLFADTMWRGGGPTDRGIKGDPPQHNGHWLGAGHEMMHFCVDRHNGFINGVFLDWSVRKMGLKELWTFKWHREYNTMGPWTTAGGCRAEDWPQWMRHFKEY